MIGVGRIPVTLRRTFLVLWDAFAWLLAVVLLSVVRYDFQLLAIQWAWSLLYAGVAIVLQIVIGLLLQVYLGRSRTGSFEEATWLGLMTLLVAIPLGILFPIISEWFPRGIGFAAPLIALVLMGLGRWLARMMTSVGTKSEAVNAVPAIVYGAGEVGHDVARLVDTSPEAPYAIVGFLDDSTEKRLLRVSRYRVLGNGADLAQVVRKTGAEAMIFAISNASPELLQHVSDECDKHGLKLVVVPSVSERIGGRVTLGSLREFNVADLLGRRPIETDLSGIANFIQGKVVLVTGAGGSIGSELARQVFSLGPERLVLVDRDETGLHSAELSIYSTGMLTSDDMVLSDIRDEEALREVFRKHRPQVVFHAAALKHLPVLERFPAEGWKTNVLGSANVLKCAHEAGVTHFVNISTDKAADASSVLGKTKRMAERLTAWYATEYNLPYLSVRFGNVLGSRGSVLFAFRTQIERGGPITVTHPEVTRYFMTIPEACQLVLQASVLGRPGDVCVLDMGEPVKIVDVAHRLMAESGKKVEIRYTGLRHGEKLHEVLFSEVEAAKPSAHPLINSVDVPLFDPKDLPAVDADTTVLPEFPEGRMADHEEVVA